MRSPPPTAAQVAAHRYAGARLRAALVAREPVPGHEPGRDPGRTPSRALAAGAALAVLGVVAAAVVGVVRGDEDWRAAAVVRGTPSGQLFVVTHGAHGVHGPDRLVPVLNLASARLLADAASGTGGATPVAVRDDALADVPRSAPAGIPGAPGTLPGPAAGPDDWAVCDAVRLDPSVPDPQARPARTSVVLGGVGRDPLGRTLGAGEALLARGDDGTVWLVQDGRRARVDPTEGAVLAALDLARVRPRVAGPGFLRVLPEAPPLAGVVVPGAGTAPADPATRRLGVPVGSVVSAGGGAGGFFLVLRDGVQPVPAVVAQLVRFTDPDPRATAAVTPEDPAVLAAAPRRSAVDLAAYPSEAPRPVGYDAATVVCAHPDPDASRPAVVTASDVLGAPVPPTPLDGVAGLDGALVAGAGAWVADPGGGAGLVVDPAGRVYPVPTPRAAAALGLGAPRRAPAAVLDLLPRGPALEPADAALLR